MDIDVNMLKQTVSFLVDIRQELELFNYRYTLTEP